MHKTLTVILLGASWALLAGCEGGGGMSEPAEGLPQNEAPRTDPDVQIGRSDTVDPGEPATPDREPAAPAGQSDIGGDSDLGGGSDIGGGSDLGGDPGAGGQTGQSPQN